MKIADSFLRGEIRIPEWMPAAASAVNQQMGRQSLLAAEAVVDVTNVAEYLFSGTDQEVWNWESDFLCVTPPFRHFAMSYKMPRRSRSRELGETQINIGGFNILAMLSSLQPPTTTLNGQPNYLKCEMFDGPGPPKLVGIQMFVGAPGDAGFMGPFLVMLKLDSAGRTERAPIVVFPGPLPRGAEAIVHELDVLMFPIALAISFMHCKNAKLVEQPVPPKLAKARARRGDSIPLLRHHTLEIEPMKRVLADQGRAGELGLQQALHICRGHFKDYRESGLFGQHKGLFWWDSHVRGSAERGAVLKEYSVGAPEPAP